MSDFALSDFSESAPDQKESILGNIIYIEACCFLKSARAEQSFLNPMDIAIKIRTVNSTGLKNTFL